MQPFIGTWANLNLAGDGTIKIPGTRYDSLWMVNWWCMWGPRSYSQLKWFLVSNKNKNEIAWFPGSLWPFSKAPRCFYGVIYDLALSGREGGAKTLTTRAKTSPLPTDLIFRSRPLPLFDTDGRKCPHVNEVCLTRCSQFHNLTTFLCHRGPTGSCLWYCNQNLYNNNNVIITGASYGIFVQRTRGFCTCTGLTCLKGAESLLDRTVDEGDRMTKRHGSTPMSAGQYAPEVTSKVTPSCKLKLLRHRKENFTWTASHIKVHFPSKEFFDFLTCSTLKTFGGQTPWLQLDGPLLFTSSEGINPQSNLEALHPPPPFFIACLHKGFAQHSSVNSVGMITSTSPPPFIGVFRG